MPRRFYYISTLTSAFLIPALVELIFIRAYINFSNLLIFLIGILILGGIWDIWATRHGKKDHTWIWQFNPLETLGISLFGLPIEEYLFYVFSSIYIVFTWESIKLASSGAWQFQLLVPLFGVWTLLIVIIPTFRKK